MIGVLNLETSNKEKLSAKVPDNRKEITEITETELKELEKVAKQYGRDSWEYSAYLKKNFKHIGEEIPENIPFSEYHDYILRNFRITKPMKEWTDIDYKVYNSRQKRLLPGQLPPSHAHAALVGSAQANRDLRQARLAHAVFSRQRHDLPRFHGEADTGEQQISTARNGQAVHLQGRGFQTRAESFAGRGPLAFPREPRGKRRRLQGRPGDESRAANAHGNALGAVHGEHIVARENRPHPPGLHIAEPVGALHQVRDAMLGHHQRVALPLQLHQHRAQLLSRIFVEVRRGLVHHHEPRRRSKRRGAAHKTRISR